MKFPVASVLALALWALPTIAMPHNGTSPDLEKRLGINCRGSGNCNGLCGVTLNEVITKFNNHYVDQNPKTWGNGAHITCVRCLTCSNCMTHPSLCLFPQDLKEGKKVSVKEVKKALNALKDHGCKMCGSDPLHENDVSKGEITVNYVTLDKEPK